MTKSKELLEAEILIAELEAGNAELRRRIVNQAIGWDSPRVQDVAEIHDLKCKLKATEESRQYFMEKYAEYKEKYLQEKGFEPYIDKSGGYTVGDAVGLPRPPSPPYAVLQDGSQEPLTNCPSCGEMGLAKYGHIHTCIQEITVLERKILAACAKATIGLFCDDDRQHFDLGDDADVAEAELERRKLITTESKEEPSEDLDQVLLDAIAAIPDSELKSSGNWYGWAKPIGEAERKRRGWK